jgi:hypothetical protein
MEQELIKHASGYAKLGCFVFPCHLDKTPMTPHGFKDATNDRAIVRAWWTEHPQASIGIACGASGWLVLDIDIDEDTDGFESFDVLREKEIVTHDDLDTFTTRTGGGGMQIVWLQPEGVKIGNSAGKLGKGLDTRGEGGYIIAPPSGHPSGNLYQIEINSKPRPAPARLVELLTVRETLPSGPVTLPKNPSRTLQRSYERVANATQGTRNETLNKASFYLFGLVKEQQLAHDDVKETMRAAGLRAGLAENEVQATLTSAWRGAMG